MAVLPATARVVVIGAGIVGNSLVHHLAQLGWRDIVQIDKGPLPNPGGSTGHASNFIFPVDHSRELADLTLDSVRQYKELGVFTESGGYEVARSEERMEELRRRMPSARAWGVPAELVTPDHVVERVPFLEKDKILGAFWCPSVGVVDSLRAARCSASPRWRSARSPCCAPSRWSAWTSSRAGSGGCAPPAANRGRDRRDRVRRVEPEAGEDGGRVDPAHPAVAPDDLGGADPQLADRRRDLLPDRPRHGHVLLRAPARRRHGGGIHTPTARSSSTPTRSRRSSSRSSPRRTAVHGRRLDPQLEQAFELMPDALGCDGAEIRYAINGLLSLTRTAGRGSARRPRSRACGRRPPYGSRKARVSGGPSPSGDPRLLQIDVHHATSPVLPATSEPAPTCGRARRRRSTRPTASCTRRAVVRRARQAARADARGAACRRRRVLRDRRRERRSGTSPTSPCSSEYGDRVLPREHEWDAVGGRNHQRRAPRDARARGHRGPVPAFASSTSSGRPRHRPCRASSSPRPTWPTAGCSTRRCSTRRAASARPNRDAAGPRPLRVAPAACTACGPQGFADHLPAGAAVVDQNSAFTTIGLWGPRAATSSAASPTPTSRTRGSRSSPAGASSWATSRCASRISYVGELGWELYVPMEQGARVWTCCTRRGSGRRRTGRDRRYGTTGRLEKGYGRTVRAGRSDDHRGGMARPKVKTADSWARGLPRASRGRAADRDVHDERRRPHVGRRRRRYMLGGEPISPATAGH